LRDRDTTGAGTLDERLYALQHGNWNVVSIADTANVCEPYAYTGYGDVTVLTGAFGGISSNRDWTTTVAGYRWDKELGTYHARQRNMLSRLGRWHSRDPVALEAGARILQDYVGNNPLTHTDPFGLCKTWTHEELTTKALVGAGGSMQVFPQCINYVLVRLVRANLGQDKSPNSTKLERHYTRDIDGTNGNVLQANVAYLNYVARELREFRRLLDRHAKETACGLATRIDCDDALGALGRVTHSWQDYYAHAVLLNGDAGPAWSAEEPLVGSPDELNRELKPCSWGSLFRPGEHGWTEPAWRDVRGDVDGGKLRYADAVSFVQGKYRLYISKWWRMCKCCCLVG
ncbi:MAG TPA: hypothetical protein EYP14_00730, partial [Planctomycetaceae bacterium]|nr:hypothetical protein [Planctomycetaceae bacterium]